MDNQIKVAIYDPQQSIRQSYSAPKCDEYSSFLTPHLRVPITISKDTDIITLNVSGRKFRTRKSISSQAQWFSTTFATWTNDDDILSDGSMYVEANPDAFPYLLDFICESAYFPLLRSKEKGFNYTLYSYLEQDAPFYGCVSLEKWIHDGGYTEAIITTRLVEPSHGVCVAGDVTTHHSVVREGDDRYACTVDRHGDDVDACL